ncbi:hypothetical protein LTR82_017743 [Friedmanniomyces endolithicus]|uniref:non-specific serine/threonine protein kinase n=1 Tax=Friedmanniomyces endolithicus TaxID=329885 RepID=A0AAN6F587_9PEZI|nr:hypothetical protein LTR82_017743 [Friedmanniomyces endolithicus]
MASPHDIFFCLTPDARPENARKIFGLQHNACWPQTSTTDIATEPTIGSRESTPAVVLENHSDHLALTFSVLFALVKDGKLPSLKDGIRFGTDPNHCHVLLGHRGTPGISGQHYTISVNQDLSVWLCDYSSKHGTAVTCNKQNSGQRRRNERWILANPVGHPGPYSRIVIQAGRVYLSVDLPNHASADSKYRKNLQRLYAECQKAARDRDETTTIFDGLDLNSYPSTAAASGAITPDARPLYYSTAVLGKGEFGEVSLVVQARTGKHFAAKTFFNHKKKRRAGERDEAWRRNIRREYDIAAQNLHSNIVKAFELQEEPMTIIMEYYPDGNIEDVRHNLGETAYISAFGQVLCALVFLHGNGIVHRDLKPENILVQTKPHFKVAVTDFGLAKMIQGDVLLQTFCGTLLYTAPEVYPGSGAGHDTSADIWSLSAIMLGWMFSLPTRPLPYNPKRPADWGCRWHSRLISKLRDQDDCVLTELLSSMMQLKPHVRSSARSCVAHGLERRLFRWRESDGVLVCIDDRTEYEDESDTDDYGGVEAAAAQTERSTPMTTTAIGEAPKLGASVLQLQGGRVDLLPGPLVRGAPGAAIVTGEERRNDTPSDGSYHDLLHKKARTTNCVEVSEASRRHIPARWKYSWTATRPTF